MSTSPPDGQAVPMRAIVLLAFAAFGATVNLRLADALLPQVAAEFSTSVGSAAIIVTVYGIAFGMAPLLYGSLGDRLGKYRVVMWAALLASLTSLSGAMVPSLGTLAGARFLTAITASAIVPLAMAWVGDVVPYQQRQSVLARFLTGQILGMACGQAAGGLLGEHIGWRSVFILAALVHLAGGFGMWLELRRQPTMSGARGSGSAAALAGPLATLRLFRDVLRRPWARVVVAGVFLEGGAMFGAFAYVGADLHHRFGLGYGAVGVALMAYGAGGMVYAWSAPALVPRLGERGLVGIGCVLLSASYALLAMAPAVMLAVPAILLMGFGFYMQHNTLQTNATQMAPEARGVALSLFACFFFMGQSLGVALAALVVDRHGAPAVYLASAAALLVIGLWFRASLARRPL